MIVSRVNIVLGKISDLLILSNNWNKQNKFTSFSVLPLPFCKKIVKRTYLILLYDSLFLLTLSCGEFIDSFFRFLNVLFREALLNFPLTKHPSDVVI